MHTRPTKAAITIQERKQLSYLTQKKNSFISKKSTSKFKKIRVFFSRQGVASCNADARRRGHIKKGVSAKVFLLCLCKEGFRFVNKAGEVMVARLLTILLIVLSQCHQLPSGGFFLSGLLLSFYFIFVVQ